MATLTNKTALITGSISRHWLRHSRSSCQSWSTRHSSLRPCCGVGGRTRKGNSCEWRTRLVGRPPTSHFPTALLTSQPRFVRSQVSKLEVLVSNAGISKAGTIRDHTVEDFDKLFATNVRGPLFL